MFVLLIPISYLLILLFLAGRFYFKGGDIFKMIRQGIDVNDAFSRDFNIFFLLIKLFIFVLIADLLIAPPVFALLTSFGLLIYPSFVLVKWRGRSR